LGGRVEGLGLGKHTRIENTKSGGQFLKDDPEIPSSFRNPTSVLLFDVTLGDEQGVH
jgi:hypothetical protein